MIRSFLIAWQLNRSLSARKQARKIKSASAHQGVSTRIHKSFQDMLRLRAEGWL